MKVPFQVRPSSHADIKLVYENDDVLLGEPGRSELVSSLTGSVIKITNNALSIIKTITRQRSIVQNAEETLARSPTHKPHIDSLTFARKNLKLQEDKLNRLEPIKENISGARVLNHTALKWQLSPSKNPARDIPPLVMAAVIEDVQARKGYRAKLMMSRAGSIRNTLTSILGASTKKRITTSKGQTSTTTKWKWWDGLTCDVHEGLHDEDEVMMGDLQSELVDLARLQADQVDIQRIIRLIERSPAARLHPGCGKKLSNIVASEVHAKLVELAQVRIRLNQTHISVYSKLTSYRFSISTLLELVRVRRTLPVSLIFMSILIDLVIILMRLNRWTSTPGQN